MEKRRLGNTGLEVSVLGFGGFHLLEITAAEASRLLNAYLDRGGNYLETAASYGDGISETKIGSAVSHRRDAYILATKSGERTAEGCAREIERSLKNLRTDRLDVLFMHGIPNAAEVDKILGPDGAMEAAVRAQKAGKVRYIGITGHGRPDGLLDGVRRHPFAVLMTGFNYLDRFNYPQTEGELLPLCLSKGVGVLAMKTVADGYLYRSLEPALRYALSLPVASAVMGINSPEMLERDLRAVEGFRSMTDAERQELYRTAPELKDYVCRLCGRCARDGFDPQKVFLLEGLFDRQMADQRAKDAAQYALQERLRFWFGQRETALKEYAALEAKVDPAKDYGALNGLCPYGIDVDRKLKVAHGKLSAVRYIA